MTSRKNETELQVNSNHNKEMKAIYIEFQSMNVNLQFADFWQDSLLTSP